MAHTAPLVGTANQQILKLLRIDIEALSELVERLLRCYVNCEIPKQFPAALKFMNDAIADPRWQLKLDYLHCLYLAFYAADVNAALAIVNRYRWQDVEDAMFLTLWLDLKSSELNHIQLVPIDLLVDFRTN